VLEEEEEKEPSDRGTRSGIGHLCDYCNIKQGWSVIFNSFDEYVNHVVKNHPGQKVCHNGPTDLNAFAEKSRIEWEQGLARHQREYLKYLFRTRIRWSCIIATAIAITITTTIT
jgi:hypothetical protein